MKNKLQTILALLGCAALSTATVHAQTLLAHYALNEGTGTTAHDSVGNLDLTLTTSNSTLKWSADGDGLNNTGYALHNAATTRDSGNKAINTDTGTTLDNLSAFTVTGWFNAGTQQTTNGERLISTDSGMTLYFDGKQSKFVLSGSAASTNVTSNASTTLATTDAWVFFAVTVDTTVSVPGSAWSNAVKFYVGTTTLETVRITNGNASTTGGLAGMGTGNVSSLALGNQASGSRSLVNVLLADFSIYSGALTAAQIETVRFNAVAVPEPVTTALLAASALLVATALIRNRKRSR